MGYYFFFFHFAFRIFDLDGFRFDSVRTLWWHDVQANAFVIIIIDIANNTNEAIWEVCSRIFRFYDERQRNRISSNLNATFILQATQKCTKTMALAYAEPHFTLHKFLLYLRHPHCVLLLHARFSCHPKMNRCYHSRWKALKKNKMQRMRA